MYHPETMFRLASERQQRFIEEARHDRVVRALTSVQRHEPAERFRVRDLRWILFRPFRPLGA
ncbi:MAG: hypothetical protein ABIQ58_08935 [Candidatus Limnocylindrales bacterium]